MMDTACPPQCLPRHRNAVGSETYTQTKAILHYITPRMKISSLGKTRFTECVCLSAYTRILHAAKHPSHRRSFLVIIKVMLGESIIVGHTGS